MKIRLSKQQWQTLLDQQAGSGLSVAAFCRDNNLSAKNFYNQRSNRARRAPGQAQSFVRAQLEPQSRDVGEITLRVGKNQLHIPASIPPQWLADLMVALQ